MSTKDLVRHMRLSGLFSDPASVDFIEKVMAGAGFAPGTRLALSPGILKMRSASPCLAEDGGEEGRQQQQQQQQQQQHQHQHQHKQQQQQPLPRARVKPTPPNHDDAVLESEEIIFSVVDELLLKSGASAADVDVVVTTCSCFAPVPSLAASVVNRFGMRADVLTASLVRVSCRERFGLSGGGGERKKKGGKLAHPEKSDLDLSRKKKPEHSQKIDQAGAGCGGNVVVIDLAARVLRSLPRSTKGRFAVVVCTENITNNWSVAFFFPLFFFLAPRPRLRGPLETREKLTNSKKTQKKKLPPPGTPATISPCFSATPFSAPAGQPAS